MTALENFESAFSTGGGTIAMQCACGKTYYDSSVPGWFEAGELENLQTNSDATDVDHSVGSVYFNGAVYATDCDCWHASAEKYMVWMDTYGNQICEWFALEKKRLQEIASSAPTFKR